MGLQFQESLFNNYVTIPRQSIITHLHLTTVFHMQTCFLFSAQGMFFYCVINLVIFHMLYFLLLELKLFTYLAFFIYISVESHTIKLLDISP